MMRQNGLKDNLRLRRTSIGSWVTLYNPSIPEIMAQVGFKWLVVDMEHSSITLSQAQHLIQSIEGAGAVPLVRVGENNPSLIKRVMDCGAYGVIVPMVNTKEEAIRAVDAVRYPPSGKRGVGLTRAQGYGFSFEDYKKWLSENAIVIAQIEHIEAIRNLKDILSVRGIDGTIIGPYDLSASLGHPGDFHNSKVKEALAEYERICKSSGKPLGIHSVPADGKRAKAFIRKGYTFLALSLDIVMLGQKCRDELRNANQKT